MSNPPQSLYWFDATSGEIFLSHDQLPRKKSHLYLVVNREKLFFNSFSMHSKKRVKDNHILSIQGHFIPFERDYTNIIYGTESNEEKRFLSWAGPLTVKVESYFYDEIPESLLFKGDPGALNNFNIFVFQRLAGYEIIYFNGSDFYSLFEKEAESIVEAIILLARKFSIKDELTIYSDTYISDQEQLPEHLNARIHQAAESDRWFFMPDYFPVKKRFSNISQNKQLKSIKNIMKQWNRNLILIASLLLLVVLVNGAGFVMLKKENSAFKERFNAIEHMDSRAEMIRFRLNKIKNRVQQYPDHMRYLNTVSDVMDIDSTFIAYSLGEGQILLEGYSTHSLGLLTRLRKSGEFKEVRFKTTVTKNVHSQREKFEIEILLFGPGEKIPANSDKGSQKKSIKKNG
jgi:hypothetical protein